MIHITAINEKEDMGLKENEWVVGRFVRDKCEGKEGIIQYKLKKNRRK